MKTIRCWDDLREYGVKPLTGEACGLGYRLLCDVTEEGHRIIERCFDVTITLAEPWNREAIGSIMLAPETLVPLGVFALLESGCCGAWRHKDGSVVGIEAGDAEHMRAFAAENAVRRYAYEGTAGSRNRHEFTGRVR